MRRGKEDDCPAMWWYPKDYNLDIDLAKCSYESQGIWMRLLNAMWMSNPRGYLCKGSNEELARIYGIETNAFCRAIKELGEHGVYSTSPEGLIYSRREVRDAEKVRKLTEERREAAKRRWGSDAKPMQTGMQNGCKTDAFHSQVPHPSPIPSPSPLPKKDNKINTDTVSAEADAMSVYNYYCKNIKQLRKFETWKPKILARLKTYSAQDLISCIQKLITIKWYVENKQQGFHLVVDSDLRVENLLLRENPLNITAKTGFMKQGIQGDMTRFEEKQ